MPFSRSAFVLDEQLCFALHSASRAMTGACRDGLDGLGLTCTQYVVPLVWEHDSMPMSQLGERLHLDSATLSPVLKRMARRRLVRRRRAVEITCTAAGHAPRGRVHAVHAEVEDSTGLTAEQLAAMRADLHRMAARLRDRGPVGRVGGV